MYKVQGLQNPYPTVRFRPAPPANPAIQLSTLWIAADCAELRKMQVRGGFTYENWIAGIRAGRTFASNGPLLQFTVDDQGPGRR